MQRLPRLGGVWNSNTSGVGEVFGKGFSTARFGVRGTTAPGSFCDAREVAQEGFWRSGEVGDSPSPDSVPGPKKLLSIAMFSPLSSPESEGFVCEALQGVVMKNLPNIRLYCIICLFRGFFFKGK